MLRSRLWRGNAQQRTMAVPILHKQRLMNPNTLTDQLGLFLAVLETGSFSAAAIAAPRDLGEGGNPVFLTLIFLLQQLPHLSLVVNPRSIWIRLCQRKESGRGSLTGRGDEAQ